MLKGETRLLEGHSSVPKELALQNLVIYVWRRIFCKYISGLRATSTNTLVLEYVFP